jgi:hypothetical protein
MRLLVCLVLISVAGASLAAEKDRLADASAEERRQRVHRVLSVDCFNRCWTLIDKADRTPEDVENMVLLANSSLWHWKQRSDCKPLNLSIAYWQVSRVHALAGEAGPARRYGKKCLEVTEANRLSPFYVGYAYEALARAEAADGDTARASEHLTKARSQLAGVADKDERALLAADLDDLGKRARGKAP